MTIEQFAREVLEIAIDCKLIAEIEGEWEDPHPQARSAGELGEFCGRLEGLISQCKDEGA